MIHARTALGACMIVAALAGPAAAEPWPQWRGPRWNGTSVEQNPPVRWGGAENENIAWRLALPGPAGASPVVWGDHIFLTSAEGRDLVLIAVSTSGSELWKRRLATGNEEARGDEGNSASPSPCTDGEHVWALMGQGELGCYDFDGNEIWKFNLQDRYGRFDIQFGYSSTPVLEGDRLYLQMIHSGGASVVALDKATGEEAWKAPRPSDARDECEHSYASPILYRDEERAFLLTHGADYVIAHRLEDGKELWRCGGMNPRGAYNSTLRFVASPAASPGLIVVPSAKRGPVLGLKPDGQGDITKSKTFRPWTRPQDTPDVSSPLIVDGLVYLCRENGNLVCLDAKTGKEYYEERTHADRHRASPAHAAGKVYVTARDGTVTVVKAGRTFAVLASNEMGEGMSASPAIADGVLYLRTFEALYAIREPGGAAPGGAE